MNRETMITEIVHAMKANGMFVSGDLYLSLVFRTEVELRGICRELHIYTRN